MSPLVATHGSTVSPLGSTHSVPFSAPQGCQMLLYGRGIWEIVQTAIDRWFALGALYKRKDDGSLEDC